MKEKLMRYSNLVSSLPAYAICGREVKKEMEGVLDALQVDVDQESILTEFYKIDGTPTFILFRKGEQLWR